jgi:hypothetical protein
MHGGGGVIHATDDRVLIGVLGHPRKILADFDARDVGLDGLVRSANLDRRVGLHVPGVELRRSADEHEEDAVHLALRVVDSTLRLQTEHLLESQP